MRSTVSETEILPDWKNEKTERETSAPQHAESQVELYFLSKAILANMSHFGDTWGSKWSNLVCLAARQGSWRLLDCALATVYSIKSKCTLLWSPGRREGCKAAPSRLFMWKTQVPQTGIKIVHLVSLYAYHHQWTYQPERIFSHSKKFPVDKRICHESYTQAAPVTTEISLVASVSEEQPCW